MNPDEGPGRAPKESRRLQRSEHTGPVADTRADHILRDARMTGEAIPLQGAMPRAAGGIARVRPQNPAFSPILKPRPAIGARSFSGEA